MRTCVNFFFFMIANPHIACQEITHRHSVGPCKQVIYQGMFSGWALSLVTLTACQCGLPPRSLAGTAHGVWVASCVHLPPTHLTHNLAPSRGSVAVTRPLTMPSYPSILLYYINRHAPMCAQAAEEKTSETTKAKHETAITLLKGQYDLRPKRKQCFPHRHDFCGSWRTHARSCA